MYATFAPVLHYNALQGDFVGGNFWDMRASGYRLQNPSAEQAQGPPTNPVEMGLPDSACLAYRLSKASYRKLFEAVWGADSFAIQWPKDVESVFATPGPPAENDLDPVHLSVADRQRANHVYDSFGLSAAAYEASPEDLFAAQRAMRERGEELLAIYHSHPRSANPQPSETDVRLAYYPSAVYLIVGLGAEPPNVGVFRISESAGSWEPVEYEIVVDQ